MDAGALDQKIVVEASGKSTNALGEEIDSWSVACTPWAKVMETPGREFLVGDYRAEEKAVFIIRWRSIDSLARVQWGGRTWRIDGVTGTRRGGFAYLHCTSTNGAN